MKRTDPVIQKETLHIALGVLTLGAAVQLGYVLLGRWGLPVLAGGLLGSAWAVLNFWLMGLTMQNSLGLEAAMARRNIQTSYTLRTLGTCAVVVASVLLPFLEWVPAVAAVFAPRLTIAVMSIFRREYGEPVQHPLPPPPEDEDDEDADEMEKLLERMYGGKVDYTDAVRTAGAGADGAASAGAPGQEDETSQKE